MIRQGDYLARLAHRYSFNAQEVWDLPENEPLRERRASPDILYPGDILHIPVVVAKPSNVQAGSQQQYVANVPNIVVTLELHEDNQPLPHEPCEVAGLPGENPDELPQYVTDARGTLELSIPVTVAELEVYVPAQHTVYRVRVGGMDPIDEVMGVVKRLRNIGYLDDDDEDIYEPGDLPRSSDDWNALLEDAVAAFQRAHGLEPSGVVDDPFRKRLVREHGC